MFQRCEVSDVPGSSRGWQTLLEFPLSVQKTGCVSVMAMEFWLNSHLQPILKWQKWLAVPWAGVILCLGIAFLCTWGVCRWLQLCSLTGHGGSAAARVFKLFRSEHGEYFNVSSSSEWVQGETGGPNGVAQGQDALSLQTRAFSLAPIRPLTCHRVT